MANGYSSAERRANVAKQLRDRKGRWIEMGAKVRFLANGIERVGEVVGISGNDATVEYRGKGGRPQRAKINGRSLDVINSRASLDPSREPAGSREPNVDQPRRAATVKNLTEDDLRAMPEGAKISDDKGRVLTKSGDAWRGKQGGFAGSDTIVAKNYPGLKFDPNDQQNKKLLDENPDFNDWALGKDTDTKKADLPSGESDSGADTGAGDDKNMRAIGFTDEDIAAVRNAENRKAARDAWQASESGQKVDGNIRNVEGRRNKTREDRDFERQYTAAQGELEKMHPDEREDLERERMALTFQRNSFAVPDDEKKEMDNRLREIDARLREMDDAEGVDADAAPDEATESTADGDQVDVDANEARLGEIDSEIADLEDEAENLKDIEAPMAERKAVNDRLRELRKERDDLAGGKAEEAPEAAEEAPEAAPAAATGESIDIDDIDDLPDGAKVRLEDTINGDDDITEFRKDNGSWVGSNGDEEVDLDTEAFKEYINARDPKDIIRDSDSGEESGRAEEDRGADSDSGEEAGTGGSPDLDRGPGDREEGEEERRVYSEQEVGIALSTYINEPTSDISYLPINTGLRNEEEFSGDIKSTVEALDQAMRENTLGEDMTLYRGAKGDWLADLSAGDELTDRGFMSASRLEETALDFTTIAKDEDRDKPAAVFELSTPADTHAYDIGTNITEDVDDPDGEQEILLDRGSTLRIDSVEERDGIKRIKATVLPGSANSDRGSSSESSDERDVDLDEVIRARSERPVSGPKSSEADAPEAEEPEEPRDPSLVDDARELPAGTVLRTNKEGSEDERWTKRDDGKFENSESRETKTADDINRDLDGDENSWEVIERGSEQDDERDNRRPGSDSDRESEREESDAERSVGPRPSIPNGRDRDRGLDEADRDSRTPSIPDGGSDDDDSTDEGTVFEEGQPLTDPSDPSELPAGAVIRGPESEDDVWEKQRDDSWQDSFGNKRSNDSIAESIDNGDDWTFVGLYDPDNKPSPRERVGEGEHDPWLDDLDEIFARRDEIGGGTDADRESGGSDDDSMSRGEIDASEPGDQVYDTAGNVFTRDRDGWSDQNGEPISDDELLDRGVRRFDGEDEQFERTAAEAEAENEPTEEYEEFRPGEKVQVPVQPGGPLWDGDVIGKQEDVEGYDGPPMYEVRVDGERLFFDATEIRRAGADSGESDVAEGNGRAPRAGDNVLEREDLDLLPNGSVINGGGTTYTKDERGVWRRDDRQSVPANDLWRDYGDELEVVKGAEALEQAPESDTTDAGAPEAQAPALQSGDVARSPQQLEDLPVGSLLEDGEERSFTKNSRGEWVDNESGERYSSERIVRERPWPTYVSPDDDEDTLPDDRAAEEQPADDESSTATSDLEPEDGVIKQAPDGRNYVAGANGSALFEGDRVRSTKDGLEGEIVKIEGNGKYVKVRGDDGKIRGRRNTTVEPASNAAPADAPESQSAPAPAAAPNAAPARGGDRRQYDENGRPFTPSAAGDPIYEGTEVKSRKDGLEGTVVKVEGNGQYVQVLGADGKKRGRKASTLDVVAKVDVDINDPNAPDGDPSLKSRELDPDDQLPLRDRYADPDWDSDDWDANGLAFKPTGEISRDANDLDYADIGTKVVDNGTGSLWEKVDNSIWINNQTGQAVTTSRLYDQTDGEWIHVSESGSMPGTADPNNVPRIEAGEEEIQPGVFKDTVSEREFIKNSDTGARIYVGDVFSLGDRDVQITEIGASQLGTPWAYMKDVDNPHNGLDFLYGTDELNKLGPPASAPVEISTPGATPESMGLERAEYMAEMIRNKDYKRTARPGQGAMGDVDIVELPDGSSAVVKSVFGMSRWNQDPGDNAAQQEADAEVLAARLGQALGITDIGAVEVSTDRDAAGRRIVAMEKVPGTVAHSDPRVAFAWADITQNRDLKKTLDSGNAKRTALLDFMIGNTDRHAGNWFIEGDNMYPIDHGFAWGEDQIATASPFTDYYFGPKAVTNNRDGSMQVTLFAKKVDATNPWTRSELQEALAQLESIKPEFETRGRSKWYDRNVALLNGLIKQIGEDGSMPGGRNGARKVPRGAAPAAAPAPAPAPAPGTPASVGWV